MNQASGSARFVDDSNRPRLARGAGCADMLLLSGIDLNRRCHAVVA